MEKIKLKFRQILRVIVRKVFGHKIYITKFGWLLPTPKEVYSRRIPGVKNPLEEIFGEKIKQLKKT